MQKTIIKLSLVALAAAMAVTACKKNKLAQKDEQDPGGKALVKFGYFTPVARNAATHVKVNDARVSNTFTYAVCFPGGGYNMGGQTFADYIAIDGGIAKTGANIKLAVPNVGTANDSLTWYTGVLTNLQVDKKQTIMFTDTVPNVQATVISDEAVNPPATTARYKFFNGIPNVGANLDLYISSGTPAVTSLVASNIAYKGVSNYFDYLTSGAGTLTFIITRTGQSPAVPANVLASYGTSALQNGRVYTILSRGFTGVTTSDIRRPQVSLIPTR